MQPAASSSPSPTFASLLAGLAMPSSQPEPGWGDDSSEDQVATLSYERALRAHARYSYAIPTATVDRPSADPADPESSAISHLRNSPTPASAPPTTAQSDSSRNVFPPGTDLKSASITIRLSKAENAQLRRRAAEAGLSVSAYLRSCTFEAETLRALVKDTLTQLRAAPLQGRPAAGVEPSRSSFQWWRQLWTRMRTSQRIAHA